MELKVEKQLFGSLLKDMRRQFGLSMRALASAADMDPAYLSRIENGKSGAPKQETVAKLARALCTQQGMDSDESAQLTRQLMVAAGLMPAKEDLIDDLEDRFAMRLRDEGFPEDQIDNALARIPMAVMRKVLLGTEKLEIGYAADYSGDEIAERTEAGEEVLMFAGEQPQMAAMTSPPGDSASDYLDRHAREFATRRRSRRERAEQRPHRVLHAGPDIAIHVNRTLDKKQEQQLRLLAKLIESLLETD